MIDSPALWLGTLAAAALAGGALLPLSPTRRRALLTAALILAPALVAADNWEGERLVELRENPAWVALAATAGAALVGALAALFGRAPQLLPLALIAALPIRVPIELAGSTANLLLPLYAVIAAGLVAAWLRTATVLPSRLPDSGPGALLGWALAAALAVYAIQAGYADDLSVAVENVCFFFAPFAALFVLLASASWDRRLLALAGLVVVVEALVFALVGFGQYAVGELFWNDKVIAGNEAHAWFRVNSLFYDPNILARYLAVTMVLVAAVAAWGPARRRPWAVAVFVVLLIALALSFSQSGLLALTAGILVLLIARWGAARGLAAAVAVTVLIAITALATGGGGLDAETSGRTGLARGGLELAGDRPLTGFGSGSFPAEFEQRFGGGEGFAAVSHNEPITVAAEQGAIGLLPYAALLVISLGTLWVRSGIGRAPSRHPLAAALLAAYVVMVVHSLGYAAFLIDPITWALLALAVPLPAAAAAFRPASPQPEAA